MKGIPEFAHQQQEVDVEVDAEEDHEHRHNPLDVRRIAADRAVFDAEAARAGRAKGRTQRLIGVHFAKQQEHEFRNRQHDVEPVEDLRGKAHLRHQLAHGGAGALRLHQMHVRAADHRQHGQQEHKHAPAADPVGEAAPDHRAMAHDLHGGHDARAGRRKAGDGLKQRVDEARDLPRQDKGNAAEHAHRDPAQRRGDKRLARVEARVFRLAPRQQRAAQQAQRHDQHKRPALLLAVDEGREDGQRHERRLDFENPAEDIGDALCVHLASPRLRAGYR